MRKKFSAELQYSSSDNFHQTLRDNNNFANLSALKVRLNFGGSQCQLLSFFFVGSCSHFQAASDFPIYLDNWCYHLFSDQVFVVFRPRLLMDTYAISRKVLLMQILQKQNETDRMRKNRCCILIIVGICCTENCPEAFLSCFKLCELGVIPVLVNTIPGT